MQYLRDLIHDLRAAWWCGFCRAGASWQRASTVQAGPGMALQGDTAWKGSAARFSGVGPTASRFVERGLTTDLPRSCHAGNDDRGAPMPALWGCLRRVPCH